jgi:hypothetical protein
MTGTRTRTIELGAGRSVEVTLPGATFDALDAFIRKNLGRQSG